MIYFKANEFSSLIKGSYTCFIEFFKRMCQISSVVNQAYCYLFCHFLENHFMNLSLFDKNNYKTNKCSHKDVHILFVLDCSLLYVIHSSPRRLAREKKSYSYNHKIACWVSHEYYLNPEFHKILSIAF